MPKFKVWNKNEYPYTEVFKGDKITIPAGKFVIMEEDDAVAFRGTYSPRVLDADGNDLPQGFKKIWIERLSSAEAEAPKPEALRCMACSYEPSSQKDLDEHSKAMHASQVAFDEAAEKELKAKKKAG